MISYKEALKKVLAVSLASRVETVRLSNALNRRLSEDVFSSMNVPPFDNSAMDGYAVCASRIVEGGYYDVSQRIPAGIQPSPLEQGTVARIFTGAIMPANADAVVIQENATVAMDGRVSFSGAPDVGSNVRMAGDDIRQEAKVLSAGETLSPAAIGLLASIGVDQVACIKQMTVAIFSSGDELKEPGESLALGQIYNSNRYMLAALLSELGCQVADLGVVEDTAEATYAILEKASAYDCVISTGGMSVGEEDHVLAQAAKLGQVDFYKVAMKPGKPFAMGKIGDSRFFGLPGNPVSTFATFYLLVRPWLLKSTGCAYEANVTEALLERDVINHGGREDFLRVELIDSDNGTKLAKRLKNQSSGVLSSIVSADGLMPVPPRTHWRAGQKVRIYLI